MDKQKFKTQYKSTAASKMTIYTLVLLVLALSAVVAMAWFSAMNALITGTVSMAKISADVVLYDNRATETYLDVLGQSGSSDGDDNTSIYNYDTFPVNANDTCLTNYVQITNTSDISLDAYIKMIYTYTYEDPTFINYYYFLITDVTTAVDAYNEDVAAVPAASQSAAKLTLYNTAYAAQYSTDADKVTAVLGSSNVKLLSDLKLNSQICPGSVAKNEVRYFRIDICCHNMPQNIVQLMAEQEVANAMELTFNAIVTLKQAGAPANEGESGGETIEVSDAQAFLNALAAASNGDTIYLLQNITLNVNVTVVSRVSINLNGYDLTIHGNLAYDTLSAGLCKIIVPSASNLQIDNSFLIDMPNAEMEIVGAQGVQNIVLGDGTNYETVRFDVNCVRDRTEVLRGFVLTNTQIILKTSAVTYKMAPMVVESNTRVEVGENTTTGNIESASGAHDIKIVNYGYVPQIRLANMASSGSSSGSYYEIEVFNFGVLTNEGQNDDSAILVPSWSIGNYSHSQYPSSGTPNTYIYNGDSLGNSWYVREVAYFTQNDITRSASSVQIVTRLAANSYRVAYKANDYGFTRLQEFFTHYFSDANAAGNLANESISTITSLTFYTYDDMTVGATATNGDNLGDWDFMNLSMTSLSNVNLAFASLYNDEIPANAFQNKTSLVAITLPTSAYTVGANAFEGTSLKEISLNNLCVSIGNNAFKVGGTSVAQNDWLRVRWTDSSEMASTLLNAFNVDRTVVFMKSNAYTAYLESAVRTDTWYFNVYEDYTQSYTNLQNNCTWYMTTVSGTNVKVIYYSGAVWSGTVPAMINGTWTVSQIGNCAFYQAFAIDNKVNSTTCNLSTACTQIGANAFVGANFSSLSLQKVTAIGSYAFYQATISSVTVRPTAFDEQSVYMLTVGDHAFAQAEIGVDGTDSGTLDLSGSFTNKLTLGADAFDGATLRSVSLKLKNLVVWNNSFVDGAVFYGVAFDLSGTTTIKALAFLPSGSPLFSSTKQAANSLKLNDCYVVEGKALNGIAVDSLYLGIAQSKFATQAACTAACLMGDGTDAIISESPSTLLNKVYITGWLPDMTAKSGYVDGENFYFGKAQCSVGTIYVSESASGKLWSYFINGDSSTTVAGLVLDSTVTAMGTYALKSLTYSGTTLDVSNVTAFDEYAITSVTFSALTTAVFGTTIGENAFFGNTYTTLQTLDLSPATTIGPYAFSQSTFTALTKLDVSNTTTISNYAFYRSTVTRSDLYVDATNVQNIGTSALGLQNVNGRGGAVGATSRVAIGISDEDVTLSACTYSARIFFCGDNTGSGFAQLVIDGELPTTATSAFAGSAVGNMHFGTIEIVHCTALPAGLFFQPIVGALYTDKIAYMTNVTAVNGAAPDFSVGPFYSFDSATHCFTALTTEPSSWRLDYESYFTDGGNAQLALGRGALGGIFWNDVKETWWSTFFVNHIDKVNSEYLFEYCEFGGFTSGAFTLSIDVGTHGFYHTKFTDLTSLTITSTTSAVSIGDYCFDQTDFADLETLVITTGNYNVTLGNFAFSNVTFDSLTSLTMTTGSTAQAGALVVGTDALYNADMPSVDTITITSGRGAVTVGDKVFSGTQAAVCETLTIAGGVGNVTFAGYPFADGTQFDSLTTINVTSGSGALTFAQGLIGGGRFTALTTISVTSGSGALNVQGSFINSAIDAEDWGLTTLTVSPASGLVTMDKLADSVVFPTSFTTLTTQTSSTSTLGSLTFTTGVLYNCEARGLTSLTFTSNSADFNVNGTFKDSILSNVSSISVSRGDGDLTLGAQLFSGCNLSSLTSCDLSGATSIGDYIFQNATVVNSLQVDLRNVLRVGKQLFSTTSAISISKVYVGINDSTLRLHALNPSSYQNDCYYGGTDSASIFNDATTALITVGTLVVDGELPSYASAKMLGLSGSGSKITYSAVFVTSRCSLIPAQTFQSVSDATLTIGNIKLANPSETQFASLTQRTARNFQIGESAFSYAQFASDGSATHYLETFSTLVSNVGANAFEHAKLNNAKKFDFAGAEKIGDNAFYGVTTLSANTVDFDLRNVAQIGSGVFFSTIVVDEVTLGITDAAIDTASTACYYGGTDEKSIFGGTTTLNTLTVVGKLPSNYIGRAFGVDEVNTNAYTLSIGLVTISSSVSNLPAKLFYGAYSSSSASRLTIGKLAMDNATSSGSTFAIGEYCFCKDVINDFTITFANGGAKTTIGQYAFAGAQIAGDSEYIANPSREQAFATLLSRTTYIYGYAFDGATVNFNGADVTINNATIATRAFNTATLSDINELTLNGCNILANCFAGATLTELTVFSCTECTIETSAFDTASISAPSNGSFDLVLDGSTIKESCFAGATLTRVDTITMTGGTIQARGFASLTANSATSIILSGLTAIGDYAFYQASVAAVTTITLANDISIGSYVFSSADISALQTLSVQYATRVAITEGVVPSIGANAFSNLTLTNLTSLTVKNYVNVGASAFYNSVMANLVSFKVFYEDAGDNNYTKLGAYCFANTQMGSLNQDDFDISGIRYYGYTTSDGYVFAKAFVSGINVDATDALVIGKYCFASCNINVLSLCKDSYAANGAYSFGGDCSIVTGAASNSISYSAATINQLSIEGKMPTTSSKYMFGSENQTDTTPTYTTLRFGDTVSYITDYAFACGNDSSSTTSQRRIAITGNMYFSYDNSNGDFALGDGTAAQKVADGGTPSNWVFLAQYTVTTSGISGSANHVCFVVAALSGKIYVPSGSLSQYQNSALASCYTTYNNRRSTLFGTTGSITSQTWGNGSWTASSGETINKLNKFVASASTSTNSSTGGAWNFTLLNSTSTTVNGTTYAGEASLLSFTSTSVTNNTLTIPDWIEWKNTAGTTYRYLVREVESQALQEFTGIQDGGITTISIGRYLTSIGVEDMYQYVSQFVVNSNNTSFAVEYYYSYTTGNGNNQTTQYTTTWTQNTNYTLLASVLHNYSHNKLIKYAPAATSTTYTVKSTVYVVGSFAFENSQNLTTLTFANLSSAGHYLVISDNAFRNASVTNYVFQGTVVPILTSADAFSNYRTVSSTSGASQYTYTTAYVITVDSATVKNSFAADEAWSVLKPIITY